MRVSNDAAAADGAKADPVPIPTAAAMSDPPAAVDVKATVVTPPVNGWAPAPDVSVPVPLAKPAEFAKDAAAKNTPISIFISRKEKKIYVRQNFEPVFDAAVTIEQPERAAGNACFHGDELSGRPHDVPLDRRIASRRAADAAVRKT